MAPPSHVVASAKGAQKFLADLARLSALDPPPENPAKQARDLAARTRDAAVGRDLEPKSGGDCERPLGR